MATDTVKNAGLVRIQFLEGEELIKELLESNLVVSSGLDFYASRATSNASAVMSHMGIGAGTAAAASTDTTLQDQRARVALQSAVTAGHVETYTAIFPVGTAVGTVAELGIFNAVSGGTMLNRVVFPAEQKEASTAIRVVWAVTQS